MFIAESKYYLSWWRCFFGNGISDDWSWQKECGCSSPITGFLFQSQQGSHK